MERSQKGSHVPPLFQTTLGGALVMPFTRPIALIWSLAAPLIAFALAAYAIHHSRYSGNDIIYVSTGERALEQLIDLALHSVAMIVLAFASQVAWFYLSQPKGARSLIHLAQPGRLIAAFWRFIILLMVWLLSDFFAELVLEMLPMPGSWKNMTSLGLLTPLHYLLIPNSNLFGFNVLAYIPAQSFVLSFMASALSVTVTCAFFARMCTLLPSALLDRTPKSIGSCWTDTRGQTIHLSLIFLMIYVALLAVRTLLIILFASFGDSVASTVIQWGGLYIGTGLWFASAGLIVYRQHEGHRLSRQIRVFD